MTNAMHNVCLFFLSWKNKKPVAVETAFGTYSLTQSATWNVVKKKTNLNAKLSQENGMISVCFFRASNAEILLHFHFVVVFFYDVIRIYGAYVYVNLSINLKCQRICTVSCFFFFSLFKIKDKQFKYLRMKNANRSEERKSMNEKKKEERKNWCAKLFKFKARSRVPHASKSRYTFKSCRTTWPTH